MDGASRLRGSCEQRYDGRAGKFSEKNGKPTTSASAAILHGNCLAKFKRLFVARCGHTPERWSGTIHRFQAGQSNQIPESDVNHAAEEVILPVDGKLLKQLSSRRLQYDSKARIQLEPKDNMRARGLSSPDRADAVIGAAVQALPGFGSWLGCML